MGWGCRLRSHVSLYFCALWLFTAAQTLLSVTGDRSRTRMRSRAYFSKLMALFIAEPFEYNRPFTFVTQEVRLYELTPLCRLHGQPQPLHLRQVSMNPTRWELNTHTLCSLH